MWLYVLQYVALHRALRGSPSHSDEGFNYGTNSWEASSMPRVCTRVDLHSSKTLWIWMLCWSLSLQLLIDNRLTCCPWAQLLQPFKNIDHNGQKVPFAVSLSLCASTSERIAREYSYTLVSVPEALHMLFWQPNFLYFDIWAVFRKFCEICGGLGAFWTSVPWSIVNLLSILCYPWHSGVVEAAQIPSTIDILTHDGARFFFVLRCP